MDLEEAVGVLRAGGLVGYPTETFYGLGGDAFSEEAVLGIFALKGRDFGEPVSVIIGDESMLGGVTGGVSPLARRLMDEFWPGPLTIIFDAAEGLPERLTAGTGSIGVRLTSCEVAGELSRGFGGPITATSANPSGEESPDSARMVRDYFGESLYVIDGGTTAGGEPSTLVDARGEVPIVLREGVIKKDFILRP